VRRPLQLSLFALVLLGLVGGCVAYYLAQKSLTLTVDGQSRQVRTYAGTVSEVLQDEGLVPAAHDVVLPAQDAEVSDGDTVVLNRARPLELTVDGVSSQVYVTALSVDEALDQLGYRADDLVLSASRSERLPLDGMQLSILTPKDITLVVDGQERVVSTTAATAGDLLAQQGVTLGPDDRTSLGAGEPLPDKSRLQVFRVHVDEVTETTPIPHARKQTDDPDAVKGDETVTQKGVDGVQTTTYRVTTTDGAESGRQQLSSTVTKPPVDELVSVGTKARPAATGGAAPSTSDGLNWAALAKCESGGNPRAVNPAGYYGLYQFSLSTWKSVGGSGNPIDASAAEQTARAQALYARSGASQWGCGRHLSD
jgi:uncharacterized protein YabE (DUF348 family)